MRIVIVDGNNLIHKINDLKRLFGENPESAQLSLYEKLKTKLSRNDRLLLVFDGFGNSQKEDIIFSGKITADEVIRKFIEDNYEKKSMALISSDRGITGIAEKCGVEILKSEDFVSGIKSLKAKNPNLKEKNEKPETISKKDFNFFKDAFK